MSYKEQLKKLASERKAAALQRREDDYRQDPGYQAIYQEK